MGVASERAVLQYATTTEKLRARLGIHRYGTNPQSWWSWLETRLPRAGHVLEAGGGTGELWRHLDPPPSLVLTDASAAMCATLKTSGHPAIRCDAAALPFPSGHFDTVIANHMLYHVDNPSAALAEFARVLRPGGHLAVATNGAGHMAQLDEAAHAIGRPCAAQSLANFSAESGPALVAAHFADVSTERYPADLAVPTPEPVLAYLASMAEPPMTTAELAAARAYVTARMTPDFPIEKHTVLITATKPARRFEDAG